MPYFLETTTYRLRGHFEPDDQSYVDPAELAAWRTRDPIETTQAKLVAGGMLTADDIVAMEERVRTVIERAVAFAVASPFPAPSELFTDVYA
jgi:acetoin:2,6-dichlorophenolindophenol oxidoreductase subunit alpha